MPAAVRKPSSVQNQPNVDRRCFFHPNVRDMCHDVHNYSIATTYKSLSRTRTFNNRRPLGGRRHRSRLAENLPLPRWVTNKPKLAAPHRTISPCVDGREQILALLGPAPSAYGPYFAVNIIAAQNNNKIKYINKTQ